MLKFQWKVWAIHLNEPIHHHQSVPLSLSRPIGNQDKSWEKGKIIDHAMQCWMKTDITWHTCLPLVMISPTPCESGSRISVWKEIQSMFCRQSSLGNVGSNGRHCQAVCLYLVVTPRKLPIAVLPVTAVLVPVVLLVLVITQWLPTSTWHDCKIWLSGNEKYRPTGGRRFRCFQAVPGWNSADISIVYSTESLLQINILLSRKRIQNPSYIHIYKSLWWWYSCISKFWTCMGKSRERK